MALGLILVDAPFVTGASTSGYLVLLLVGPTVGLLLLVAAPGWLRQIGTGLLASGIAYPAGLISIVVVSALVG